MKPQLIKLTALESYPDSDRHVWVNISLVTHMFRTNKGYTDIHSVDSLVKVIETPEEIQKIIEHRYVHKVDSKGYPT